MVKSYAEVEDHIQEALGSISPNKELSISELAKEFNVPAQQLQNGIKGTPSHQCHKYPDESTP